MHLVQKWRNSILHRSEEKAYDVEIQLAKSLNNQELADKLKLRKELRRKEIYQINDNNNDA